MVMLSPALELAIFSGKGGVGKTTLACALTRQLARAHPERRILLVSTDPAHSLGDVLGLPIGDEAATMPDLPNLRIRALDAEHLLDAFKATYGEALQLIAERGSWFGREDLLPVWDLAWPGVDELMAILEVNRLLAQGETDTIVLDTAPTGHTLRLLSLPDFLDNLLEVFATFQAKHREISEALTGTYRADKADAFLLQLEDDLRGGKRRLTDPDSAQAWLVMIPEALSLAETERFCAELRQRRVPIGGLLVNQVLSETGTDLYRARQAEQGQMLRILARDLAQLPTWWCPYQLQEPLGAAALDRLVEHLKPLAALPPTIDLAPTSAPGEPGIPSQRIPDLLAAGIRLAVTGGKGGVGKTTVAGAIAWHLARSHPDRRILVVSIDPAHSLGDLFRAELGQDPVLLRPNLLGQEIDAEAVLQRFRADYLDDIVGILAGQDTAGIEVRYDPAAWKQLLEMPPPGLDEVMALLSVVEQMESGQFDLVVLDTAPTGHLLRFLQMPEALEGWVSLALKLWLKYRDVVGRPELAQRLRGLLKQVRALRDHLQDPDFVTFIPVFNPEQAVLAETQRLLQELDRLGIPHPYAVINRIWADRSDAFGLALSERHDRILAQLDRILPNQMVVRIPFVAHPTLDQVGHWLIDHGSDRISRIQPTKPR